MKLVFLADFFPKEYILKDPDAFRLFGTLGKDMEIKGVDDPVFQSGKEPMAVIRQYEKSGIESVEPALSVLEAVADADILLVHWSAVNRKVIDAAPNLKFIGSLRSGWENIDKEYAESKGITVKNCPGRLADSVADLAVSFMLQANKALISRNLVSSKGKWPKAGAYQEKSHRPMCLQTVGLVGYGLIAQSVAMRLRGFGCKIQAYDPYTPQEVFDSQKVRNVDLDTLLESSDIISLHARVTDSTKGMIGKEQFDKMQKHCIFVNTARADLVDEEAMIEALQDGKIQYAALDVFAKEPIPEDYPLLHMDNVLLTPHIGGTFPGVVQISMGKILEQLQSFLANL